MPDPVTWGNLFKAVDDETSIEEEILGQIATHNTDISAHGQNYEALYNHRADDPLDHPEGSVTTLKLDALCVTDAKVASGLSAAKITTGTLTLTAVGVNLFVASGELLLNPGAGISLLGDELETGFLSFVSTYDEDLNITLFGVIYPEEANLYLVPSLDAVNISTLTIGQHLADYNESWNIIELGHKTATRIYQGNTLMVNVTGDVLMPPVYSDIVGGTNRDLYIDNTGKLGYVSSSRRYKDHIVDLDASPLYALRPVQFDWKRDGSRGYGLIAEEVAKVLPDIVTYDDKGRPESVEYSRLIPFLVKAVQDLKGGVPPEN